MAGKVVKQLAGSGTGQSLSDLMTAMKYTLSGSVVVKIICKATTEEMCAPKRKHLSSHGISLFLRPYAKYLDEKAASYREVAFDFCRLKRGKEDGDMRTMPQDKLMKTLPVIEKQLDALLMFDATLNELSNSLLRVAHLSLYRDLIRLYAVYNEGMINLIGRYFTMSKRDCRVSLEIYKNFLKRMESMNTFVRVAESAEPGGTPLSIDSENNPFKPLNTMDMITAILSDENCLNKIITSSFHNISPKPQPTTNPSISNNNNNDDFESLDYSTGSDKFILTPTERQRIIEEEHFNDVPTNSLPFGSNKSPPLLLSAQSTSTLVPVAISPGQLHSTNPFLFNTHPQLSITSKDFMSNQRVSANSTSTSPQVQSNSNTIPSKSLISLDDKIAQIAGNLSIYDSYSSTQAGRIYRAPDGSLSTINWSGTMPCVQVSTVSNQQMSQVSTIHQSPSLNQIIGPVNTNHQSTASIPLNPTNPWAASAQSNISYQTQSFMNNPILLNNNNNGIVHRSMNNPFL
ncbi:phosphatidylinositol-binding clathrin assembly protein [Schistosoma bovis]|uniref:Phosphatidylinositol-binding clathrin assembly protein n=1 Tax=Schistosoma bovis TaxID=6184 RepID=A0A430Q2Y1_SCHBO|nr:phosphatidylinositol-binding clathrin assembly protein [Schistosoma bovis]